MPSPLLHEPLHHPGHGDGFFLGQAVGHPGVAVDLGDEVGDLVTEPVPQEFGRILLDPPRILEPDLEGAGQPPGGGGQDIAVGPPDHQLSFGFYAHAGLGEGQAVLEAEMDLGIEVDPVWRLDGLEGHILIAAAQEFEDREQSVAAKF